MSKLPYTKKNSTKNSTKNKSALLTAISLATFFVLNITACSSSTSKESRLNVVTPPPGFIANEQKGESLYSEFCSECHGTISNSTISNGKSNVVSNGTTQGPPLIHHIYKPGHHPDMFFYKAVQFGTYQHHWRFGNMPPVKNITPQQTGHIIKFIRTKQSAIKHKR